MAATSVLSDRMISSPRGGRRAPRGASTRIGRDCPRPKTRRCWTRLRQAAPRRPVGCVEVLRRPQTWPQTSFWHDGLRVGVSQTLGTCCSQAQSSHSPPSTPTQFPWPTCGISCTSACPTNEYDRPVVWLLFVSSYTAAMIFNQRLFDVDQGNTVGRPI